VAVKTIRPDILSDEGLQEGEAIARFEREARAAASVRHPNVVDVTDFGQSPEGVFFLVMEYVDGESLYQLLRREGTLDIQRTVKMLAQVVAGVDAAHDEGILHRDLKPANIFIMQKRKKTTSSGLSDGFIKVGDFGLAKIVYSDRSETTSQSGPQSRGIIGTPEYMAPEQMQQDVQLDARADVYAIGAIAYHMLGGRPPFLGDITQLIAQKLMQSPAPLRSLRSDIPVELDKAIMHALERARDDRPSSATVWFEELEAASGRSADTHELTDSRLVVMAPSGSEVYVDDERQGSVGRSGRVILSGIAPGQHVLRVARAGEVDDERVIEIRPDGIEQIIQAQFKSAPSSDHLTPSRGGSLDSRTGGAEPGPQVVACIICGSRFAEGVKFCGRCGNGTFQIVADNSVRAGSGPSGSAPGSAPGSSNPSAPGSAPGSPNRSAPGSVAQPTSGATVTCPRCQQTYSSAIRFCGKCGIPVGTPSLEWRQPRPVEVVCKLCGTSYAGDAKFCGQCGKLISP
jgi:serine/threonine protein kinase